MDNVYTGDLTEIQFNMDNLLVVQHCILHRYGILLELRDITKTKELLGREFKTIEEAYRLCL